MSELTHFLLIEDDEVDIMAVKREFRKLKLPNPLTIARDGHEALRILRGDDGHPPLSKPYLIILDLNMPRMDGLEFLSELRADPIHRTAVVFVLTTSKADDDLRAAYRWNVAGYIVKSNFDDEFSGAIEFFYRYQQVVELPQK